MPSDRMVVGRDEMDRMIMMRMDVDRYENQTIPALHQQTALLRQALLEYGRHKSSCGITEQSQMRCTCGLDAAMQHSGRYVEA